MITSTTQQMLYRLNNLNAEQTRISYQMSTKKILDEGSDDTEVYKREVYIDDRIRTYKGLKVQIERTTAQNNVSDSTLGEAKNLLTQIKAEIIKSLNGTTDDDAKKAIAVNLEGIRGNLFMLSNEEVEGEFLFSGSNSTVKPFTEDSDGKITYNGDGFLRKVAVEDGYYRERGITGLETFFYAENTALKGETLDFTEDQRVLDQDGYEWKKPDAVATGDSFLFDASQPVIDDNGNSWTLNTSIPQLENGGLGNIPVSLVGGTTYEATVPGTVNSLQVNQLIKVKEDGTFSDEVSDRLDISGTSPDFTVTVPNVDGTKFEAKSSIFDLLDKTINALNRVDENGNTVSSAVADEVLKNSLDEIDTAFNAMNVGHGKLGGRNNIFEVSLDRVSAKLTQFNILKTEVGTADYAKVAVEAKALELTYTALYSTINKMNQLSLVNFVR
ncbi:MAG: flagellar hook-associated protein FlgL [Halarcobacter sp.]